MPNGGSIELPRFLHENLDRTHLGYGIRTDEGAGWEMAKDPGTTHGDKAMAIRW